MDRGRQKKVQGEWAMGVHSLEALIANAPHLILRVFLTEGHQLQKKIEQLRLPIEFISRGKLDTLLDSSSHQRCAAQIHPEEKHDLRTFLEEMDSRSGLLVALDGVQDPHNFGAILRAAESLGVLGLVFSPNRCVGITPAVRKVSTGASFLVPLIPVSNLATSLGELSKAGWTIILADASPGALSLGQFKWPARAVLVLGSEGEGARALTAKRSDLSLKIPQLGKIQSMNVSQAASIFFWDFAKAHLSL